MTGCVGSGRIIGACATSVIVAACAGAGSALAPTGYTGASAIATTCASQVQALINTSNASSPYASQLVAFLAEAWSYCENVDSTVSGGSQ